MINPIRHFALTGWSSVHDEEALTALELQGRSAAKINECVDVINKQIDAINEVLGKVPEIAGEALAESISSGVIAEQLNDELMRQLRVDLANLNARISNLAAISAPTEGNTELIDARTGADGSAYPTAGDHVRAIASGEALSDAVRPGVVKADRIMAGNLGGSLAGAHKLLETIPMAGKWERTGYYDEKDLFHTEHSGYSITTKIPCEYGDTFTLRSYIFGPLVRPAVVFDASGRALEVLGDPGHSDWSENVHSIQVSNPRAAFICFICGASHLASFRAMRHTVNRAPDPEAAKGARGYLRMRAKKRTDTVTDRAQIKVWFELPANRLADQVYSIPLQLLPPSSNIAGWTMRLFGATSASTYDVSLVESAAGYTFDADRGLCPIFKVPLESGEGVPLSHVALFIDFLPVDGEDYMDAYLLPVDLHEVGVTEYTPEPIPGTGYTLHGALDTDILNIVRPGAIGSPLRNKRILGMGDSLMSGNTLKKTESWFDLATGSMDMVHYNGAINGLPLATPPSEIGSNNPKISMEVWVQYVISNMRMDLDYFVLIGGANDKRLNVPLQDFRDAIGFIITIVRQVNPRCKILTGTNWRRTTNPNSLGLYDADYVAAMLEISEEMGVPCINNFAEGLDLTHPVIQFWADEGTVSTGTPNLHFSVEANKVIATRYARELEKL